jgi:hypothetical protein
VDGNKRIGPAALEITLVLNGMEWTARIDAPEAAVLAFATGEMNREGDSRRGADNPWPVLADGEPRQGDGVLHWPCPLSGDGLEPRGRHGPGS